MGDDASEDGSPHLAAKVCGDCGLEKPHSSYDRNSTCRDGLSPRCKECRRAYNRATYRAKRDGLPGRRPRRALPEGWAWCPACGTAKPFDDFARNASTRTGRTTYCKPCHNAAGKASKERMGGSRDYHLKRRYGLTSADVEALVEAQGGRCAVCQERDPQHVDHDHGTGEVRGVLCSCCNQGLGSLRDRAQLLRAGAAYLERSGWQSSVRVVREAPGVHRLVPTRGA